MKKMTFMNAARDYFGMLPGQKPMEFGREIKALSGPERDEFKTMLEGQGYEIMAAAGLESVKQVALA